MTGFNVVNLKHMVEELGEEYTNQLLKSFSCPMNRDVELFLKRKAIDFSKQGFSQTHLVFASYKDEWVLAGYYCLANKVITIKATAVKGTLKKRINRFANFDAGARAYVLSAPLIGQLGKNYASGLNKLMTGDELLHMACDKVKEVQAVFGGRFVYLECERDHRLLDFYTRNGFCEFDERRQDGDETNLKGDSLVQLLKYLR